MVIPKPVRDSAGWEPGARLEVRLRDGRVEIESVPTPVRWVKKSGLVVAVAPAGAAPLTTAGVRKLIEEVREERSRTSARSR